MESSIPLDTQAVIWSADPDHRQGRPLLILMHGYGSNEQDLYSVAQFLPDEPVFAALRAPSQIDFGYSWYPAVATDVSEMRAARAGLAADAVLAWLDEQAWSGPVGLLGFSQGGSMAIELMRARPEDFAFAVQLSGFVMEGERPGDAALLGRRPPVFWGWGDYDEVIPAAWIEPTRTWLSAHSALEEHVYHAGHSVTRQELDDVSSFISSGFGLAPSE